LVDDAIRRVASGVSAPRFAIGRAIGGATFISIRLAIAARIDRKTTGAAVSLRIDAANVGTAGTANACSGSSAGAATAYVLSAAATAARRVSAADVIDRNETVAPSRIVVAVPPVARFA
jgi:hypothetical protein